MLARRLLLSVGASGSFAPPVTPPGPDPSIGEHLTKQGVVIGPTPATWTSGLVESPAVFWDSAVSKYVMVYTGMDGSTERIGYCTAASPDGPWTQYGSNPILAPTGVGGDPDQGGVTGPFVWQESGTYYLVYIGATGGGYENGTKSLCLATSIDWIPGTNAGTWTRRGAIISPTSGWRSAAIYHPNIVKRGSTYYLFFNAADGGGNERIGYASASSVLGPWTVDDVNSPLTLTAGRNGDPCLLLIGSTWQMAYYTLDAGASDYLAFCDDADFPVGPWTPYASNPVLRPSESYDGTYAHKPFTLLTASRYYHWYTAVGSGGRQIALATEDV